SKRTAIVQITSRNLLRIDKVVRLISHILPSIAIQLVKNHIVVRFYITVFYTGLYISFFEWLSIIQLTHIAINIRWHIAPLPLFRFIKFPIQFLRPIGIIHVRTVLKSTPV